jgi:hypothetical protein
MKCEHVFRVYRDFRTGIHFVLCDKCRINIKEVDIMAWRMWLEEYPQLRVEEGER